MQEYSNGGVPLVGDHVDHNYRKHGGAGEVKDVMWLGFPSTGVVWPDGAVKYHFADELVSVAA